MNEIIYFICNKILNPIFQTFFKAAAAIGEAIKNFETPTFTTTDIIPIILLSLLLGLTIKHFYIDQY